MDQQFMIIRGARILQQLNETTYNELERETLKFIPTTKKRQHVANQVHVNQVQLIPFRSQRDTGDLKIESTVTSNGKRYDPIFYFSDVIYEDGDQADNVSFKGGDGEQYHIMPISLSKNNVKVRCSCLDFYYRFSGRNRNDESLYGQPFPPYQRRTNHYPSANPNNVPGLCKHLLRLIGEVRGMGVITN